MNSVRQRSQVFRSLARGLKQMVRGHCEATGDFEEDVAALLAELRGAITDLWNEPEVQAILTAKSPRLDFAV